MELKVILRTVKIKINLNFKSKAKLKNLIILLKNLIKKIIH